MSHLCDDEVFFPDLARAKGVDSEDPSITYFEALLLRDKGDPARAASMLRAFLDRGAADQKGVSVSDAFADLAGVLAKLGDWSGAVEALSHAIDRAQRPSPQMYIDHARALSRTGETGWESTALTSLDEGIKRLGRGSILLGYAIDLEVQRGAIEAALQRIEEQIAIPGYRFQALVKKAEILEQAGRDDAHNAYVEARAALDALPGKVKRTYAVRKLLTRATDGVKSTGGNLEESGSSGRYVSDR